MNKTDFLAALEKQLKKLKKADRSRYLDYYSEMIDDYTEDGCTEQEAIRRIGTPGDIAHEILAEQKDSPEASTSSSKKVLTTVLLIIGSPLWASVLLLIVALALSFAAMAVCLTAAGALLVLTAYVMLWCVPLMIASLSIGALVLSVISLIGAIPIGIGNTALGIVQFGTGIGMLGLFILTALATVHLGRLFAKATVRFTLWLKHLFRRKKGAKA